MDFKTYLYPLLAVFVGLFVADQLLYDMIFTNSTGTTSE